VVYNIVKNRVEEKPCSVGSVGAALSRSLEARSLFEPNVKNAAPPFIAASPVDFISQA
jgi:hypothetical protein